MDGVICRPPLGLNIRIARGPYHGLDRGSAARIEEKPALRPRPWSLISVLLALKYIGRSPMLDAKAGLAAIKEHRDMVLITSRNSRVQWLVDRWLARNGMSEAFDAVYTNSLGLASPDFKWHVASKLGIQEFIDDDGRVTDLLAKKGLRHVYLRDWPRNRGYDYPEAVVRVQSLIDVAEDLARLG